MTERFRFVFLLLDRLILKFVGEIVCHVGAVVKRVGRHSLYFVKKVGTFILGILKFVGNRIFGIVELVRQIVLGIA